MASQGFPARDSLLSIRAGDIAVVVYLLSTIVATDGSLLAQSSRILLVFIAGLEFIVRPRVPFQLVIWQFAFVGYVVASVFWAFSEEHAATMAQTVAVNGLCVVALASLLFRDPARLRLAVVCIMFAPTLLMLRVAIADGLSIFFTVRGTDVANANFVGQSAAYAFGLAYLCWSQWTLVPRSLAALLLISNVSVVLLSGSRKALLMVVLVILLFTVLHNAKTGMPRSMRIGGLGLVCFAAYLALINIPMLYSFVGQRLETMVNGVLGRSGEVDASTETRVGLIERGLDWFQAAPWFGHGGENFRALMEAYFPTQTAYHAHNNFIEVLVSYGIGGFILFYWIYVAIVVSGLKHINSLQPLQVMLLSLVLTQLVIEYGQTTYYSRFYVAFIAVSWVALCSWTLQDEDALTEARRVRR